MLRNNIILVITLLLFGSDCNCFGTKMLYEIAGGDTNKVVVDFKLELNDNEKLGINCIIFNGLADTILLLPQPFFIEGDYLNQSHTWVFSSKRFSCPNIVYFQRSGENIIFDSDGEYLPLFHNFPQLSILGPYDTLKITIALNSNLVKLFTENSFDFFGAIVYSLKREADFLAQNSTSEILDSYNKCLNRYRQFEVKPLDYKQFTKMLYTSESSFQDQTLSQVIWNMFRFKAASK